MKNLSLLKVSPLALAISLSSATAFAPIAAQAETTASGNIGVHSMYLLRGIGRENDNTAVQGGFDYNHDSGLYLGYWGSNLGYSYDKNVGVDPGGNGFENDFYGGYAGSAGDISYKLGLIQYYYINVDDSDLTEVLANVGYAGFTLQAQYLANDGWWGNAGDIYWTLGYSLPLPNDFTLGASLGYYTYNDDDTADLCGAPGCSITTEDGGYRHLNLTLSHPIADTGANMYVQYTNAGEDRTGFDNYDDKVIFGVTYGFGL
jgi:uncharacterized protein (TIGR02001 family)